MSGLAFLDTETITLEPGPDVVWEIGLILRDEHNDDTEWRWQLRPNMDKAHPKALEVSRFHERFVLDRLQAENADGVGWWPAFPDDQPVITDPGVIAEHLAGLLAGRHVVGAVPNFDTERLSLFLRQHAVGEYRDPWHYHLVDVENLAVGYLAGTGVKFAPPWRSEDLSRAIGVEPPGKGERHTALGDARWCRDMWSAIVGADSTPLRYHSAGYVTGVREGSS